MRILLINRMLSLVRGGGETFDLEIGRHLAAMDCRVDYLAGLPLLGGVRTGLAAENLAPRRLHHVRTPWLGWFPWDRVRAGWRVRMADIRLFERAALRWLLREGAAYDVIQLCELPGLVRDAKERGFPKPMVLRLTAPDYYDPFDGIRYADAVVASGTTLAKLALGPRPDAVDVPNAVDTEFFAPRPSGFRRQHGLSDDDLVILLVARYQAVKDHAMLIRAFGRVLAQEPRAFLVLAGSGPLEQATRRQCRQEGAQDRTLFLGEVRHNDLPAVYAAADIKVISSVYESYCFAALEAMAAGLPLVVTDTEWVPGLIGDAGSGFAGLRRDTCGMPDTGYTMRDARSEDELGDFVPGSPYPEPRIPNLASRIAPGGLVVPIGDADAMAAALLALARDPALRRELGAWNRRAVLAAAGWENSARKLRAVYERVAKNDDRV
ncbi:MAG: glycosyltransferase family 4 protein [Kiritimatiellae bacterium]|nr:glycosyltransferase family 4 protein [Kiritimatiellia bacterium]